VRASHRALAIGAASAAVMFGGAALLYAWDERRNDEIAKGVRVAGVDIGGLRADAARAKLAHDLALHLARPIVVRSGPRTWELRPRQARLRIDVQTAVQEALERSRRASFFVRTARAVVGSTLHDNIAPRVSYSKQAVKQFLEDVRRGVDRPARDATVRPLVTRLEKVPARDGFSVEVALLRRKVGLVLSGKAADRTISVSKRRVRPKVRLKNLVHRYPNYIVVNRSRFELRYYHRLELAKAYRIAVGRQGLETPAGPYEVQDKQVNPSWHVPSSSWAGALAGRVIPPGPDDPLKARWLGFNGSAGIHGTDVLGSLGTAASHGCIRMSIPDVEQLYRRAPLHTPVYIR